MTLDATIVIPTIGRESLQRLLTALDRGEGPRPAQVIVVDDRPAPQALTLNGDLPVKVLESGGRGPAAARNVGWRAADTRWVCFLDDDVLPTATWLSVLAADLAAADAAGVAGSQGRLDVPREGAGRPTDDEQRTLRLATARWITADMAYRGDVLVEVGGFDARFPRAYREDSDIALRITTAGHTIAVGDRRCEHPVAPATWRTSLRVQAGNRDNALMRRKFGPDWRARIGEGDGRLPAHTATTAAAVGSLLALATRRHRVAAVAAVAWAALTAEFTLRRYRGGSRTAAELGRIIVSSMLIPPLAVAHRVAGEWQHRHAETDPPLAVLLDRDDTLIEDGPYLNDPRGVVPMPGARRALDRLRDRGLLLAVVTNQSGVARGLITPEQLGEVNAEVVGQLGTFDSWQVCLHAEDDGCACRKPAPGMVLAAAAALGVPPQRCVLIGDTGGDVQAALTAGGRAILVPTDRTRVEEISAARSHPCADVAPTLTAAVDMVLRT
ncbi:HAD-IIIA family hydrolase [Mycolicibacterium rufum]|uniref:D,D-heptose 1,7-bisphosphate phosphatase n=1 Tax=Mycolicibacterium rufum TaxID=318424 RepID=A0ABY3UPZ2_9MYCO|nr:HAD-IIIA family hydrolase [Mycolicibacterium rufum]KGI68305.1 HAD family hydrolase [Mycolicibacterium rufum]ULP39352.1 HAD-IIIA family hydrolase [Mycolicibacterium rufum]